MVVGVVMVAIVTTQTAVTNLITDGDTPGDRHLVAAPIPKDCAPILERLECSAEKWVDFVKNFRKRFRNEAGLPKTRQTFRTTRRASRSSVKAF